jgi:hypothetical protein
VAHPSNSFGHRPRQCDGLSMRYVRTAALGLALFVGALTPQNRARADAPLDVDLNKLESLSQDGPGCRLYFLISNPDPNLIRQLRLELFVLGSDGVIARRVAVELGPLRAKKTAVRAFDLQGLACDNVSRILVNSVLACDTNGGMPNADQQREACLDRLLISSHAKAAFAK